MDMGRDFLSTFLCSYKINGYDSKVLCYSGSGIDLIHRNYVLPGSLIGRTVWINSVCTDYPRTLSLVHVTLERDFEIISANAGVSNKKYESWDYLIESHIALMIEENN